MNQFTEMWNKSFVSTLATSIKLDRKLCIRPAQLKRTSEQLKRNDTRSISKRQTKFEIQLNCFIETQAHRVSGTQHMNKYTSTYSEFLVKTKYYKFKSTERTFFFFFFSSRFCGRFSVFVTRQTQLARYNVKYTERHCVCVCKYERDIEANEE